MILFSFQFKPGDARGDGHRTFKMNIDHRFTQLRAIVASPDAQQKFVPCDVWCKNDPNGQEWRWLSPDTKTNTEMDLEDGSVNPPRYPPQCDLMRQIVNSVLVRLLRKVNFQYDANSRQYVPSFPIPYTSMECEVQQLLDEELETFGDMKAVKIEKLWSRTLWKSIMHLAWPLMTATNWDGSASAAGAGLLNLVSIICMYGNLSEQQLTHTNLAMWPEGIDLAGAPRGNPFNVNVEYMVADPTYLCATNVHDNQEAIGAVFQTQGNRPTTSFTPDFVLSARGAVLVTGDGKSADTDIYEGEQTICLVACRQFAFQESCLGLTSSNFRFRLVELEKETFDFARAETQEQDDEDEDMDTDDPQTVNLPAVKVTTYISEKFEVRAKKNDPTNIQRDPTKRPLNNPHLTTSGFDNYNHLCDTLKEFCAGLFQTMDRLVHILQPRLTLDALGQIQRDLDASKQLVPLPHFVPKENATCIPQDIWHFHAQSLRVWKNYGLIDDLGRAARAGPPPGPPGPPPPPPGGLPPPPPPPAGGAGSSSGPTSGSGGSHGVVQAQGPAPHTAGGGSGSGPAGHQAQATPTVGLPGGKRDRQIQITKQKRVVSEKLDFHGRTQDLMTWYALNQIQERNEEVWNEEVEFLDSKTNTVMCKTANHLIAHAVVEPGTDKEIREMLAVIRSAHVCQRLDVYNLLCTFLSEFVFYNPAYNRLVDFCFGYRRFMYE